MSFVTVPSSVPIFIHVYNPRTAFVTSRVSGWFGAMSPIPIIRTYEPSRAWLTIMRGIHQWQWIGSLPRSAVHSIIEASAQICNYVWSVRMKKYTLNLPSCSELHSALNQCFSMRFLAMLSNLHHAKCQFSFIICLNLVSVSLIWI